MRIVLLSGGSGKRLWPLSNEVRSKAFLRLLDGEGHEKESMIQRICRQLSAAGLLTSTHIVTHASQAEITRSQVGEALPLLEEPHKRGTFTAIALAAAALHEEFQAAREETIVVLPVDSFVEPSFFEAVLRFPGVLARSGADLALIGTPPNGPSSQFGYMVPAVVGEGQDYRRVERFVEKPDTERAAGLIGQGALWNCGVFAFRLGFMLDLMGQQGLPADPAELVARYEELPERSFDQEVVEKTDNCVAIPYTGGWDDLGSWEAFTHHLNGRVTGLGQVGADSPGTHLVNELTCPVHVIDVPDVIVAAGPDGVLVASKRQASKIKEQLQGGARLPMVEEKRWGIRRTLDCSQDGQAGISLTSKLTMLPGTCTSYHVHSRSGEICVILAGTGEILMDGQVIPFASGDVLEIKHGVKHSLRAITCLEMIETRLNSPMDGADFQRLALTWEDAIRFETGGEQE